MKVEIQCTKASGCCKCGSERKVYSKKNAYIKKSERSQTT